MLEENPEMPAEELRVLGPVEILTEDGALALRNKHARLLAALLVAQGRARGVDELVEALWDDSAPSSARQLVRVYVSQLRRILPVEIEIVTRDGSYSMSLDPQALDAARFERLLRECVDAREADNAALALSLADRALSLWRGRAYGELAYDDVARGESERLEELRLTAVEERLAAQLALGRHDGTLAEALAHAEGSALRERAHELAMLALYRVGRQADALEHYSAYRARLDAELGLEPGPALRELQRQILQQDPTLDIEAGSQSDVALPLSPNPLIGRQRELEELQAMLARRDSRLIVLTGAGGSGKTRLALEVARQASGSYANGVVFVELAPLRDGALVLPTIAQALEVTFDGSRDIRDVLADALAPQELLFVLDNAEHLREVAPNLAELVARAPRVTMLVTSRAVLHVSGEQVFPVAPLAENDAVKLFAHRARRHEPTFEVSIANEDDVREVCRRMDGLPLAIELAAAHVRILTPRGLRERLDDRLSLLTGGPRDLPARQQTLKATLEWSFGLLSDDERALAARLGVFVGSFDLVAATTVCDADFDVLTSLVDQSLLQRTNDGRFYYLETIREYALEQLLASPGADDLRRRHFRHFRELAEAADLTASRRGAGERLDLAAAARDNLRAALAWSLETESLSLGLEFATALERFWVTHDPHEGMRWFAALLDHPETGNVAPAIRASALRAHGGTHDITGEYETAERLWRESLELFEELGDEHGKAVLLHRLGISAMRRQDLVRARDLVTDSHRIHERSGDRWGQAQTIGTLGAIERDSGNETRAYELISASLTMAREAGVRWWESGLLAELATLSLKAGRTDEAEMQAREGLMLADEIGDRAGRVLGVGLFAALAALRGLHERAEQLWAAVAHEDGGAPLGGWRRHRQNLEATIREQLGGAWDSPDRTSALTLDDAVPLALQPRAQGLARRISPGQRGG